MEEKKLTDEEMLNRLELYARDGIWWDGIVEMHDILDLIYRLQDEKQKVVQDYYCEAQHCDVQKDIIEKQKAEIERLTEESNDMFDKYGAQIKSATILIDEKNNEIEQLKAELAKECEEHLAFVELAKKADEQQKAEIAELKAQCSKSSYRDSWKNKFFKAQEEIERLNGKYRNLEINYNAVWEDFRKYEIENTELQKQVDGVKASREIEINELHEQHAIVAEEIKKDTAKEIFTKAKEKAYFKDGGHYDKDRYLLDMADLKEILNGYGVEVE